MEIRQEKHRSLWLLSNLRASGSPGQELVLIYPSNQTKRLKQTPSLKDNRVRSNKNKTGEKDPNTHHFSVHQWVQSIQ